MAIRENYSRKRVAILETLRSTTVHPTAEWVYGALKAEYSDLSLGTVYRNIKRFCAEGKATSVGVFNGHEHFDGNVMPHSHFVCSKCGAVMDIDKSFLEQELLDSLSAEYGVTVLSGEVVFKGLCMDCVLQGKINLN